MTVILIDAKNALYRFGFAYLTLRTSRGDPSGATYGILDLLLRLKKKYPGAKFFMCWDGRGKSWRHRFWDGYKAQRPEKNEDAKVVMSQEADVYEICGMMNIPQISIPGVEGDDMVGILASNLREAGHEVVIYSSDKDFWQLMHRGILVIRDVDKQKKLAPETESTVRQKFGCALKDVLMVRAIAGDKSDSIPNAVAGIAEKKATRCIESGEWQQVLLDNWGNVQRNYKLMKILTSADSALLSRKQRLAARLFVEAAKATVATEIKSAQVGVAYQRFIARLGELELQEAIEERFSLWNIQSGS